MSTDIEVKFKLKRGSFALDVDLNLPDRGISALYGPSGCGKTTLLRALAGLDRYPDGYLKVGSRIWQEPGVFIPPHQRPLGYVFQEASLFPHLNVLQNIEYGLKRILASQQKVSLQHAVELMGIDQLLQRKPHELSGGERQRVAITRALAVSPELLLMDEPLAALDLDRKQEILPYIESLHEALAIPIMYVSHSPDEVARLADHLVVLDAGEVQASGPIYDMLTRLDVSLSQAGDAEALVDATVAEHDETFHLSYLDSAAGRFTVPYKNLTLGTTVRLRIAARDVSLTLSPQFGTSILNIFPATIDEIIPTGEAQVTIRLLAGGIPILARITQKSVSVLDLERGKSVYAQAKTVALLA